MQQCGCTGSKRREGLTASTKVPSVLKLMLQAREVLSDADFEVWFSSFGVVTDVIHDRPTLQNS